MSERKAVHEQMECALENASKTGLRYFILYPQIANPGSKIAYGEQEFSP